MKILFSLTRVILIIPPSHVKIFKLYYTYIDIWKLNL